MPNVSCGVIVPALVVRNMPENLMIVFGKVLVNFTIPPVRKLKKLVVCVLFEAFCEECAEAIDVYIKVGEVIAPALTKLIDVVCVVVPFCKIYKPSTI